MPTSEKQISFTEDEITLVQMAVAASVVELRKNKQDGVPLPTIDEMLTYSESAYRKLADASGEETRIGGGVGRI